MWIVNHHGKPVNLEAYHHLSCENERTVFANRHAPGQDEDDYWALYVGKDKKEAEAFLSWLLQQMEDGKRVVRVSEFRNEPMCSGLAGRVKDGYTGICTDKEPHADSEGGEA